MTDQRPKNVYGVLVEEGRVFLLSRAGRLGLPGGVFRPMAEDRKVELKAHLWDQLGIDAKRVWAQGAFDYQGLDDLRPEFAGFYSVWEWEGDVAHSAGRWLDAEAVAVSDLAPSLKILLTSVINTLALRTR